MTHELRTPLNGVLGAMHLIRDEGLTDAQNEFADTIERSGERLLGVINNVLDYSRVEAGRIEVARNPVRGNAAAKPLAPGSLTSSRISAGSSRGSASMRLTPSAASVTRKPASSR